MKFFFALFLILILIISCDSVAEKPLEQLDVKLQTVVNHCKTCHSTKEMQRGPLLEGLEDWYMKDSVLRYRAGLRGTHPDDAQGLLMYAAVKDLSEEDVLKAVEWFAGQKRPEIKSYIKGDIAKGAALYKESCFGCHEHTMGKFFSKSPDLYKLEDWYLLNQLRAYKKGWRKSETEDNHEASMSLVINILNDDDFKNIAAYLAQFQEKPE